MTFEAQVGLVVPTIFSRPHLLPGSLSSITRQSERCVLLVSTSETRRAEVSKLLPDEAILVTEPRNCSLPEKINSAFRSLPESVKYIGWLGDDDLLYPKAVEEAAKALDDNPQAVLVYGACDYIDPSGNKIAANKSGRWAARILGLGPDLIPQPGALWRRDAFEKVGGLSSEFDLAFDFDLFLKLKQEGELLYLPRTLASFRWHPDSLSVKQRRKSVLEASRVRRKHYKGIVRLLWPLWEPLVISATWLAGKLVSARLMTAR